jgi:tRNA pseudouridine55 synthase
MTTSPIRNALCGVLNVDKPLGPTSHEVVKIIKDLSGQSKVGHAGTLDPLATGVLLVCLGKATRVTQYLMAFPKTYQGAIRLGITTTTHDAEGEITREADVDATRQDVEAALQRFVGRIAQVPPMYSAVKQGGKRLYELARQGKTVEVPPRQVDVYSVQIVEWLPPAVHIRVRCGPGTYIRALARDLGESLGCGAHLASLRRTQSGQFSVDQAISLEQLSEAFKAGAGAAHLYPLDIAFHDLPALHLDAATARRLAMGQQVKGPAGTDLGTKVRAYAPNGLFVALAHKDEESGSWQPRKVFVAPAEIQV